MHRCRPWLVLALAVVGCGLTESDRRSPRDSWQSDPALPLPSGGSADEPVGEGANAGVTDAASNLGPGGEAEGGAPASSAGAAGFAEPGAAGAAGDTTGGMPEVTAPWVRANLGLPPGLISSLEVDPNHLGTVYAASFVGGGLYRTTNSGDNWQWSGDGLADGSIFDVAVDPFDSNIVFAGSPHGLFRSANGGAHFAHVAVADGERPLAWNSVFDPNVKGRIYLLASSYYPGPYALPTSEVFRSDDAGDSWHSLGNPGGGFLSALLVDPSDSEHLLLGSRTRDHGVYESSDGGASWSPIPQRIDVNALAYAPETHTLCVESQSYTYASTDHGASWQQSLSSISYLLARPGPTFYAVAGAGLFVSSDCLTWTLVHNESAYVVAAEANGMTYLGGYAWDPGVRRSKNGQDGWQNVSLGLENTDIHALALDPTAPSTLFVGAGRQGLYRSLDAAGSWQAANGSPPGYLGQAPEYSGAWIEALAVNDGKVVAAGYGLVSRSQDNGDAWVVGSMPALGQGYAAEMRSVAFDPFDSQRLYGSALTQIDPLGGVYTSDDQGLSFVGVPTAAFDSQLVVPDPTTPQKLWALGSAPRGAPAAPYLSDDGGQSWSALSLPKSGAATVLAIATPQGEPATVYVGVLGVGLFKSHDDGRTWTFCSKPEPANYTALVVDPAAPDTLYLGTFEAGLSNLQAPHGGQSGIWKSRDGGSSWIYAGRGMLDAVHVRSLVIDPEHPRLLYAGLENDGIYKTTTGAE